METEKTKCLIIGSGPAGYTAAIYASRSNMNPIVYQGMAPGGQLTTTTDVENFPGYLDGITGPEMMEHFKKQAERFGADIRWGMATKVDFAVRPFRITVDDKKIIEAKTVIIATGATAKYLGLPSENKYKGSGVSACATCDGFFYRDKTVAVVGGGDTACEEASYLAGLCKKVYMLVRRDQMRASKAMQKRVNNKDNIEILFNHTTQEVVGDEVVKGVIVKDEKGQTKKIDIDGFFLAIGHNPNTKIFKDYLELDNNGFIITSCPGTRTNIPGVFACGDVKDPKYRQAITAAASGSQAAMDAEEFLIENDLL